jgi:hypothetical protein
MSYTNGINGYKALVVKSKDTDYYDHKTISLNTNKSKTFIKNSYKYVKFQGDFYTTTTSRAWSSAPLKVWLAQKVNILLLSDKDINSIVDFYNNNDEEQYFSEPNFRNAPLSNNLKKALSSSVELNELPIKERTYKMSDLIKEVLIPKWNNLKSKNPIHKYQPPTLQSVLANQ